MDTHTGNHTDTLPHTFTEKKNATQQKPLFMFFLIHNKLKINIEIRLDIKHN